MADVIVVEIIAGVAMIMTTVISSAVTASKIRYQVEQLTKDLEQLTKKVEAHNNFGIRLTAIETKLEDIEKRAS